MLAKMMKAIENKIEQSKSRMTTKIDSKIDGLTTSLEARLEKIEKAVTEVQEELHDLRAASGKANIQRLVNEALTSSIPFEE